MGVAATVAYHHYLVFRSLARWVDDADRSDARFDFAAITAAEYERLTRFRGELNELSPETDIARTASGREHIDAAYGRLTPRSWQEAALQAYIVGGLLDDALIAIATSVRGVPGGIVDGLEQDRIADAVVDLLNEQVDDGQVSRDTLALWGRAVVGDAILAIRALLDVPDDVRAALAGAEPTDDDVVAALAQIDAFQSQLVAEHTRRMDALHLTA